MISEPVEEYRPERVSRVQKKIILMPRWGVKRVVVKETMITLSRVSLIDGPREARPAD